MLIILVHFVIPNSMKNSLWYLFCQVAAADFHITKENEGKVLKDLVTEFQCLNKDLNTKIDDLRKELKRIETNVGQEMKTPEDKLEQEMKTQGDKLEQEMKDKEEDKKMVSSLLWA